MREGAACATWVRAGLDKLRAHAAARGTDTATLALAWLLAHPRVTAPILGPRRPAHLEPAWRALDLELTPEEWRQIGDYFTVGDN